MKYRPFFAALGAGAAVMLLLPWMAVHFVKGDAGVAVCFLLFFGVNPLFSLAMGVFAGKGRKKRWSLPLVTAALFVAGAWIMFSPYEPAFLLYAAGYLILGLISMGVTCLITGKTKT